MSKFEVKLTNFYKALQRLREAVKEFQQAGATDVVRDGLIQRFEFTYELSWKTTKEYLESIGLVDRNSPKAVIKEAYAQKLIEDEDQWILMLHDRNMTSHVYNEELAEEIASRIANIYVNEFQQLLDKISKL
ncbi:nucleotidyltransferase substrate binding protein [Bacillus horti]|uniref:Nucleotidyltransferase substrate binding protein (TIGR01987 family) n=1 Tax=Caldalkalibacillus horti TaxID=77523 RepID=A0ABT9VZE9_9BACI|nr:nucleotidyltransferase substrate binding protein [Bacillus horti]MDQ0166361.1 nucleotidyltransferase substrate binding protein (TIGR01987 family) [Bacillus horti]